MTPAIDACVIHHEGIDKLRSCLMALQAQSIAFSRVIVVDDASEDGSSDRIAALFPEVECLRLTRRGGPAAARNVGFQASSAPRILFVDNDVELRPDCAAILAEALEAASALLAMPRVLRAHDPDTIDFEGAHGHWLGQLVVDGAGEEAGERPDDVRPAGSLITACFLMDRERWGGDPPFDASLPFNYEDHELGLRSRLLGHEIITVPAAECLHGSGTPGASVRAGAPYPPLRVRSLLRGRWRILLVLYQVRTLVILAPVLALFEVFQFVGAVRRGWVGAWAAEVTWLVRHRTETRSRRRRIQMARKRADRALLVGGPLPFRPALPAGTAERLALACLDRCVSGYLRLVRSLL